MLKRILFSTALVGVVSVISLCDTVIAGKGKEKFIQRKEKREINKKYKTYDKETQIMCLPPCEVSPKQK